MGLMPDGLHNIRTDLLSYNYKDHMYNVDFDIPHYCNLCLPFLSPFLSLTNRVRCIFRTDSVYKLLFVPSLYGHRYIHFSVQQFSIEDFHNENYGHNFCIWSFNFLEIFFIKNTNACCNIITYRTSILFLF